MGKSPDVLVLGGGVIGLTTAYFLARDGVAVEVVDQGDFGREASWAGAGIIPPGNSRGARDPYDRLRARSTEMFPELSHDLREASGLDNGYLCCGGLELGEEAAADADAWRAEGVRVQELGSESLHRLEPALSPECTQAVFLPDLAQVRNPRHLQALVASCALRGVRLRPGCPVYGFEERGGRVSAVRTAAGPLNAARFLVAAGAWTGPLLEPLGVRPGVRPVRGQIALLNTAVPLFTRVLMDGKRYLVPRPDGRVLVGSTEEDAGFDKRTTAEAIAELLAFAASLVPALAGAHLERCWAGLRPGSPDGLPFLGPVPGCENLFVAAGHFRAGIQLSPATGLVMKQLLFGEEPEVSLEAFRLDRPAGPVYRPAFRS